MDNIYENIEEYNSNKKRKVLIVFDDIIADMLSNKKVNPVITKLLIRGRKLSCFYYAILFCCVKKYYTKFYALFYYENSKQTRTSTNHLIMHQILTLNTLFKSLYKTYYKTIFFLVIDATLVSDNPSRFRENLSERI